MALLGLVAWLARWFPSCAAALVTLCWGPGGAVGCGLGWTDVHVESFLGRNVLQGVMLSGAVVLGWASIVDGLGRVVVAL